MQAFGMDKEEGHEPGTSPQMSTEETEENALEEGVGEDGVRSHDAPVSFADLLG